MVITFIKTILQRLYPYGECRVGKAVYLTFDDGPIPEVTPGVLDILARYGVKATFFMVGENIDKHPDVFRRVLEEGHTVANHSYNHIKGFRYTTSAYLANVSKCQDAIERHGGQTRLFRPPYGRTYWWQRRALVERGYRIILWDVLTRDYNPRRTLEEMLSQVKRETRPGSIINFHDSLKSNERMLKVLPRVIEWLQKEGYEIKAL